MKKSHSLNTPYFLLFALGFVLLAACSPKTKPTVAASKADPRFAPNNPYAVTNHVYDHENDSLVSIISQQQPAMLTDSLGNAIPSQWVGTVNVNLRKPNYVIIHFTAQDSVQQTLHTFTVVPTQVSAHYVIAKNGTVYHMLNDYMRAWHAGVSKWGSITDMNSCSIGIEIDNNGNEPYNTQQINSLLLLLAQLKKAYNIPQANFIGHQDIAPGRKPDPGPYFPWAALADRGFGYWSDYIVVPAPKNFDYMIALKLMGYDISNPGAAIVAFKRHFIQSDITPQVTQLDLNVLYNVYKKYSP